MPTLPNSSIVVVVATGLVAVLGFFFAAEVVYTQSFSAGADFDPTLAVYFLVLVIEVMLYCFSTIFLCSECRARLTLASCSSYL